MEKVSAINVFRESVALFKYKIRLIGGLFLLMLAIGMLFQWQMGKVPFAEFPPSVIVMQLAFMLLGVFLQVCFFNNMIQTLRREDPPFIPHGVVGRMFRLFLKEILLFLALAVPTTVVMVAFVAFSAMLVGDNAGVGAQLLVGLMLVVGGSLSFGVLGVRWGAGIAGAAVNERISFKESWRMTKGHTFSLVLFILPIIVPQLFLQTMASPQPGETVNFLAPGIFAITILSSIAWWFTIVAFSVWYVRLTERYATVKVEITDKDEELL